MTLRHVLSVLTLGLLGALTILTTHCGGGLCSALCQGIALDPTGEKLAVSSVRPTEGGRGTLLALEGYSFVAGTRVTVAGADCRDVQIESFTRLTCRSPSAAGGLGDVVVTHPSGTTKNFPRAFRVRNFLFTSNGNGRTVRSYSVEDATGLLSEVSSITVSSSITEMFLAASGRFLFVLHSSDVDVLTVDPRDGSLTVVNGSPFAVASADTWALHPTLDIYYSTLDGSSSIDAYQIPESGIPAPLQGSPYYFPQMYSGLGVSPDGRILITSEEGVGSLSTYFLTSMGEVSGATGSTQSDAILTPDVFIQPDNKALYYLASISGGVLMRAGLDTSTGEISAATTAVGMPKSFITFTPDSKRLYAVVPASSFIRGYDIDLSSGTLDGISGSPFDAGPSEVHLTIGLSGLYGYVANSDPSTGGVHKVTFSSNGALTGAEKIINESGLNIIRLE